MPKEERNRVMLASAKRNLESMAFVGLTEYQRVRPIIIIIQIKEITGFHLFIIIFVVWIADISVHI